MSTAGSVVELGSSFKVYCTFKCPCKCVGSMCSDHPPSRQGHEVFNSTTVYFNVANITRNKTYSCQCDCPQAPDSCGMDIFAGCECLIIPRSILVFLFGRGSKLKDFHGELCFTLQLLLKKKTQKNEISSASSKLLIVPWVCSCGYFKPKLYIQSKTQMCDVDVDIKRLEGISGSN